MIIKYCFLKKENIEEILKTISLKFAIPTVSLQIGVFLKGKDNVTIALKTKGDRWTIEMSHKDRDLIKDRFYVLSYNMKSFMNFLKKMELENGTIGFREIYTFLNQEKYKLEITFDDFIGWSLRVESQEEAFVKKVERFLHKWNYTLLDKDTRRKMLREVRKKDGEKSLLYTPHLKILTQSFIEKCQILGLNYSRDVNTVADLLKSKTNDYTYLEQLYSKIIGSRLTSEKKISKAFKIPPISIIICSYNSDASIGHTLLSIKSQDLSLEEKKSLEIIVIDDCSKKRVEDSIEKYKKDLEGLDIQIIRLEKNTGRQRARDIGLMTALNDIVLFLDSDILLPQNYIREMAVRSSIIPNAAFVSFKKNIESNNKINSVFEINKGLRLPESIDDWRINTYIKKGKKGHTVAQTNKCLDILEDSNYFKNLGFGKIHGVYAIDSMLVGHNYILRKSKVVLKDRFEAECKFSGWGLEDSYIGTMLVANGGFIIPVTSTSVYHINHPPRSGSGEKKEQELEMNLKRYKEFLNKPII